jgi:hypothetical protein
LSRTENRAGMEHRGGAVRKVGRNQGRVMCGRDIGEN